MAQDPANNRESQVTDSDTEMEASNTNNDNQASDAKKSKKDTKKSKRDKLNERKALTKTAMKAHPKLSSKSASYRMVGRKRIQMFTINC